MASESGILGVLGGLLRAVVDALFGLVAETSPPVLVHPVHGRVENRLTQLWPAGEGGGDVPSDLLAPDGLRTFLAGTAAGSQALGKLAVLGLALDPLQDTWSGDGTTIGAIDVRVVADGSAATSSFGADGAVNLTASAVTSLWRLDPAGGDGAVPDPEPFAAAYADLLTAALADRAGDPEFTAAAGGRSAAEALDEAREYLAGAASRWLTAFCALVRLRAAQQAGSGPADPDAELSGIVETYNAETAGAGGTPFLTYVADTFLGGHPSVLPMPDDEASVGGSRVDDVLRSAVRHHASGRRVSEPGTSQGPPPDPDTDVAPDGVDSPVVVAALRLAGEVRTYSDDPDVRWAADSGDCSSFVQRALAATGRRAFEPGVDDANALTSFDIATRDDLFTTVPRSSAQAGDVLVQGGFGLVDDVVTWTGHCGIYTRPSGVEPDALEGISLDAGGPRLQGRWGAAPPVGSYALAEKLLVRRVRAERPPAAAGGLPFVPFAAADPPVTVVNEAKVFAPTGFSPARVHWAESDPDSDAQPAIDATGLGVRYVVRPGQRPRLVPVTAGVLVFEPRPPGAAPDELAVTMYLDDARLSRLRSLDPVTEEAYDVADARLIYVLGAGAQSRPATGVEQSRQAGMLEPVFVTDLDGPRSGRQVNRNVPRELNTAQQLARSLAGDRAVLWQPALGVEPGDVPLATLEPGDTVTLYAEVTAGSTAGEGPVWYRVNPGFVLNRLRGGDVLPVPDEYDVATEGFLGGGVASGGQATQRSELVAVWGGSRGSLVLQPTGVVPSALFTFATCDPVRVFATALGGPQPGDPGESLSLTSVLPTLTRDGVERLWRRNGIRNEQFLPAAPAEFPATDYAAQVRVDGRVSRQRAFYDDLGAVVTYGPSGRHQGEVGGAGTERRIVPHAEAASRPPHPVWTSQRRAQLARLYPLRLEIARVADPWAGFVVTQDEKDCIRQEYVFHLKFTDDYYQAFAPAIALPTRNGQPRDEVEYDAQGVPVRPALRTKRDLVVVPRRSDLRAGDDSRAYRLTRLMATAPQRVDAVRTAAEARAQDIASVLDAAVNGRPLPATGLPGYAVQVVTRVVALLRGPAPAPRTIDALLRARLQAVDAVNGIDAIDRFAVLVGGTYRARPYDIGVTSTWRPPEQNETVSKIPNSNHQLGLATDLQPRGAGEGRRNPLALMALHLVAQQFYRSGQLSECLLENEAQEEYIGLFLESKAAATILETRKADGTLGYVLRSAGVDEPLSEGQLMTPGTDQKFALDNALPRALRTLLDASAPGVSVPWTNPTYVDMYLFSLTDASHVHHTWVDQ